MPKRKSIRRSAGSSKSSTARPATLPAPRTALAEVLCAMRQAEAVSLTVYAALKANNPDEADTLRVGCCDVLTTQIETLAQFASGGTP